MFKHAKVEKTHKRGQSVPSVIVVGLSPSASLDMKSGEETKWLEAKDINKERTLDKGSFAKVYLGTYQGEKVAIKKLRGEVDMNQISSFQQEVEILR